MRKVGTTISKENNVAGYLGVDIRQLKDGEIVITYTGLIDKIITAMGSESSSPKETPVTHGTLPKDKHGEHCN